MSIQRADWVTCKDSTIVGVVQRVARDGSWADVKWPDNDGTYTKRMKCAVLDVQHTITIGNLEIGPWQVTDETRRAELEEQTIDEEIARIDAAFAKLETIEASYRKHFGPIPPITERLPRLY